MPSLRHTTGLALAVAGLSLSVFVLPACSSGATSSRSLAAPTPTKRTNTALLPSSGRQFLAIVSPSLVLGNRLDGELPSTVQTGSALQTATLMSPWIDALEQVQFRVANVAWPRQTASDLTPWLLDDVAVANDIRDVLYLPMGELPAWYRHEQEDVEAATAAQNTVRADLGLPLAAATPLSGPLVEGARVPLLTSTD